MEYTVNHINTDGHAIKENLWQRLLNLIENENSIKDIVSKFEIVLEEYNSIERGSYKNVPYYYDFVLSYSNNEIRVSDGIKGDDFLVVSIFSETRKNAYLKFEMLILPTWGINDYINYLKSSHSKDEVINNYTNSFDDLQSMVLELEFNFIMQSDEQTLNDLYLI